MEDWKAIIAKRHQEHIDRMNEIDEEMSLLKNEFEQEYSGIPVIMELTDNEKLEWDIHIGMKTAKISNQEIMLLSKNIINLDLSAAIKQILLDKFKW